MNKSPRVTIGGLWYRRREPGRDVLSGTFAISELERVLAEMKQHGNLVTLVLFDNPGKTHAGQPDMNACLEPRIPREGVRTA